LIYKRICKGFTEAAQDAALLAAGITAAELAEAYIDHPPKLRSGDEPYMSRRHVVGAAREGDEVWVARPGVIATTEDEALRWVASICDLGAVLCIASTGERYHCPSATRDQIADGLRLAAAIRADERGAVLVKARKAVRVRLGRAPADPKKLAAAAKPWADPELSAKQAAKIAGLSVRTLYRKLGPKGTPGFGRDKP
jgi:hypothetical protein